MQHRVFRKACCGPISPTDCSCRTVSLLLRCNLTMIFTDLFDNGGENGGKNGLTNKRAFLVVVKRPLQSSVLSRTRHVRRRNGHRMCPLAAKVHGVYQMNLLEFCPLLFLFKKKIACSLKLHSVPRESVCNCW